MSTFARRFKHLREDVMRLTQDEAAERLGISRPTIAGYESEKKSRIPREEMLRKIATEFRVSVDYLLGHEIDDLGTVYPIGDIRQIPIVAEIPCGAPAIVEENIIGYFPVDTTMTNLNGGDYIWLKAKGDSMVKADIHPGSLVLIRLQPEVEDRDIAAVCVDNETATLKRVLFVGDHIILMPETDNADIKPLQYERNRVRVVGKAIKVITDL